MRPQRISRFSSIIHPFLNRVHGFPLMKIKRSCSEHHIISFRLMILYDHTQWSEWALVYYFLKTIFFLFSWKYAGPNSRRTTCQKRCHECTNIWLQYYENFIFCNILRRNLHIRHWEFQVSIRSAASFWSYFFIPNTHISPWSQVSWPQVWLLSIPACWRPI